jgi:hypothetical protein
MEEGREGGKKIISVGEDIEKIRTFGGNEKWCSHYRKLYGRSQRASYRPC